MNCNGLEVRLRCLCWNFSKLPLEADPAYEQALCAWWNSTPGILTLLHARARKLTYPRYALESLRALLVPNPDRVDVAPLAKAFAASCAEPLRPWPQMHACPVRASLDQAAAQVLRVDGRTIADWRERIAREPTISGAPANRAIRPGNPAG